MTSLRDHLYRIRGGRKRGPQGVLSGAEEDDLVQYLLKMQDLRNPLTPTELQLKVVQITQTRYVPFHAC